MVRGTAAAGAINAGAGVVVSDRDAPWRTARRAGGNDDRAHGSGEGRGDRGDGAGGGRLRDVQGSPLYDRLGGLPYIQAVVDDFVANVAADSRINKRFEKTNIPVLKKHLVDQICEASGGPCKYTGRDMKSSHTGMMITEAEWTATVEALVKTLDKYKVAEREKNEVLGLLAPMKPDIVGELLRLVATKLYVVTHPASVGIYATWPECAAAVRGVSGARYQAVTSRELAEAMLRGEPVVRRPAATLRGRQPHGRDRGRAGRDRRGRGRPRTVREVATTVYEVFGPARLLARHARRSPTRPTGCGTSSPSWAFAAAPRAGPAGQPLTSSTTKASAPGSRAAGRPGTRWWPRSSPPAGPASPPGASP